MLSFNVRTPGGKTGPTFILGVQRGIGLQQLGLETGAGFEPSLSHVEALPGQCDLASLERRAEHLGAGLCVQVLTANTLAVLAAGYLGLVTLTVVLQTARPLTVAALVVPKYQRLQSGPYFSSQHQPPLSLHRVLADLRFEGVWISVQTLFDGPEQTGSVWVIY